MLLWGQLERWGILVELYGNASSWEHRNEKGALVDIALAFSPDGLLDFASSFVIVWLSFLLH
jgi:hypothetical protein